jgi:LPS export ABC transporter permease LptG
VARPRLTVLDRYVLRELVAPFFLSTALFTFFLVIDRLYALTDLVVTKGVPFHLVVQLLVFILPAFLANTLPMALLVAVLLAGGRLAGDLEVVAFKACGVSTLRLFRPVLLASTVTLLVTAALTLVATPLASREFQRQLFRILETRAVAGLKERVFITAFGGVTVYVEELSASQVAMRGLLVSDERDARLSRIITAREGRLLTDERNRRITLRLIDGAVNEADVTPANPPASAAGDARPAGGAASAARYRYALFSLYDMTLTLESTLATQRGDKPEKDLDTGELLGKVRELRGDPRARAPFLVEAHKRLALPVAALVFALTGFPLAVRSHRGGRSVALVASLAILVAYYLVMTSLEGAALKGRLPVALAIWLPNAIFGAAGLGLLVATARERRLPRLTWLWRVAAFVGQRLPHRPALRWRRAYAEPRDSTHIVDRYLLREFLAYMGLVLLVAIALVVLVDLVQTLDRFLRLKPPIVYILEHFAYRMPAEVFRALPIVMLVATIFLFLGLSRFHELTALKAAGISLYRVSAPILALGLVVALGAGLFQELVLPRLNDLGEEVDRVKIRGEPPRHLRTRTRLWLRSADTRFYRVELLAPGTGELYGVTVLEVDRDFRLGARLDARLASWTPAGWELHDGAFRSIARTGQVQTVAFARTAVDLPERIEDFTQIQKPVAAMGYWELSDYVAKLEAAGFQVRKYLVDLYAKVSSPLENLIMVLIAIPFAIQAPRTGRLFGIALAIGITAVYLFVDRVAIAFARADLLPPLLAAWTANVVFLGVGTSLFLRART